MKLLNKDFFNEVYDTRVFQIAKMEIGLKQSSSIPNWLSSFKLIHPLSNETNKINEIADRYNLD